MRVCTGINVEADIIVLTAFSSATLSSLSRSYSVYVSDLRNAYIKDAPRAGYGLIR